jgi:tRNA-2-methylthio-N6-dimethylallyladenosine synthase
MSRTFRIETHGCQMNAYDSDFVSQLLRDSGWETAGGDTEPDLVVLNTCSVRERAEQKALARITEIVSHRSRTGAPKVAVIGCVAQRLGRRLIEVHHADLVAGPDAYRSLPGMLEDLGRKGRPAVATDQDATCVYSHRPDRTCSVTAFVTVMRGCDNHCSYCIVPHVRGRERSKPHREVVEEIGHLADLGVKEVILLGQNVNSYRDGDMGFPGLLESVNGISGIERIRFATSHPKDMSPSLIGCLRDLSKVCEHVHLPLQSGSDRVLALMNRGYTFESYARLVDTARREVPGLAVSTDILVGFPGETGRDHRLTLLAMEAVGFDSAFMFRYSARAGTRAALLDDDVAEKEKIGRLQEVIRLQNRITDRHKQEMPGRRVEILTERLSSRDSGYLLGRTRKNWLAKLPAKGVRRGETVVAEVTGASRWMLTCERVVRKAGL